MDDREPEARAGGAAPAGGVGAPEALEELGAVAVVAFVFGSAVLIAELAGDDADAGKPSGGHAQVARVA